MRLDHLLFREKEKEAECTAGGAMAPRSFLSWYARGELAQLARASALQAEGQGFEPPILHKKQMIFDRNQRREEGRRRHGGIRAAVKKITVSSERSHRAAGRRIWPGKHRSMADA